MPRVSSKETAKIAQHGIFIEVGQHTWQTFYAPANATKTHEALRAGPAFFKMSCHNADHIARWKETDRTIRYKALQDT